MRYVFLFLILCIFFGLNFKQDKLLVDPVNLNKNHMCACDGMIIINYNGPKAQIVWKGGKRSFYCEVREVFYDSLDGVKGKIIEEIFVQDFSNLEWGSYIDKWMLAKDAYFVVDSNKDGAMGLSYVPFSDISAAQKFAENYNGKILKYNEITASVLAISAELLKDRMIF